ncbi:hypothetical protein GOP47_0001444 [Adiantum capillus-veneris]|uniref:Uncharacterized protein n=1 Tax=Adiantum capillus-veneris TaxID=13818 RepID=A0A9D4ZQ29_ADICA|nr:hypothetical protein GOP47_0001444 [Adiantum capillus-veneris]
MKELQAFSLQRSAGACIMLTASTDQEPFYRPRRIRSNTDCVYSFLASPLITCSKTRPRGSFLIMANSDCVHFLASPLTCSKERYNCSRSYPSMGDETSICTWCLHEEDSMTSIVTKASDTILSNNNITVRAPAVASPFASLTERPYKSSP